MKSNKWAVAGVAGALMAGAGASFALNIPGGAGAATRPVVTAAANGKSGSTNGDAAPQGRRLDPAQPETKIRSVLQPLVDAGTISAADLEAVVTALKEKASTPPEPGKPHGPEIVLEKLVAAGTLTEAKADAIHHALEAGRPEGRPGGDRGGRGGREQRGPRGEALGKVAEVIGISVQDLQTALKGGQTIAQVAQSKGVSAGTVIDALVEQETTELRQRITDMVNGVRPTRQIGRAHV